MSTSIDRKLARCAREIAAERKSTMAEACAAFLVNTSVRLPDGTHTFITEADCKQSKGAAREEVRTSLEHCCAQPSEAAPPPIAETKAFKAANLKDLEQAVFEDWLARVCPSGDVEAVQRQWEESSEYEEFCDEHKPAIEGGPPKTEANGWVDYTHDMPAPDCDVNDRIEIRWAGGTVKQYPFGAVCGWGCRSIKAYRLLP